MNYFMQQLAIIIPTLNEENFISKCLDSVIVQTYPFERMDIMVVDGGSTDKTCEIVQEYHKKYANIRLLHNPKKIQSAAFNIGVDASAAPYIIRLDAHALYDEKYIELCIQGLEDDFQRGNVGGMWNIVPQNTSIWAEANAILNYSKFGIGGASFRVGAEAGNVDTVPFGAFPRKVLEEIGGMREDLPRGEDNEYNSRIKKAGYKIYFSPEIQCTYFARPTLMSSVKQMYANGESIGILCYIDKEAIGIRHLIPLLFVIGVVFGALLSLVYKPFAYVYMTVGLVYFCANILASLQCSIKHGIKFFVPLSILFLAVHIAYGIGTIKGLVKKKY